MDWVRELSTPLLRAAPRTGLFAYADHDHNHDERCRHREDCGGKGARHVAGEKSVK
jgi:hypothetical protein